MRTQKFAYFKPGEAHPNTHLTNADVIEIRRLYMAGELTQKKIGERFGISTSEVNKIINRRYWAHVEDKTAEQDAATAEFWTEVEREAQYLLWCSRKEDELLKREEGKR